MFRLPPRGGEWLDRGSAAHFRFEGREVPFFAGDTYGSALAAAGIATTARSFKYHRRRGLYSALGHDANALFQIDGRPNQRSDALLARAGAIVAAVNTAGGVEADRGALIESLAPFLPVGFYYKTFIGRRLFPLFEALIRHFSGLGRVDDASRSTQPPHRHRHCDVAVVGGGITGLAAALAAVEHGAGRVALIDEGRRPGGSATGAPDPRLADLLQRVATESRIEAYPGHCATGLYEDRRLALVDASRPEGGLTLLRAGAVVLATGAIEQPVVFRNNDLPRVMLASGAQALLHRYAIACGRRVVILTATPDGLTVALELAAAGLAVTTARLAGSPPAEPGLLAALGSAGVAVLDEVTPIEALPGKDGAVAAVTLQTPTGVRRLDCDALLLSAGFVPALHLALQAGGTLAWSDTLQQHLPARLPDGVVVAGRANAVYTMGDKLLDGQRAGRAAALGANVASDDRLRSASARSHAFPLFPHPRGKEFVDLDEDLTLADLRNAVQEGFDSSELLKRYSTVGMGPSQGKLSNLNALRQLAALRGQPMSEHALTTARPPWQGVTLGALAGVPTPPLRRSALDGEHERLGAEWMPAGNWRRPAWYCLTGRTAVDRELAIAAEVRAVRTAVGLIDVSTLGKIEVLGPDAAALLDLLYVGRHSDQRVGTTRYAVMLDEAGMVIDDGVVARRDLAAWYVTATTGAAAATYREMQRLVVERRLDCVLHNLTGAMAAVNLAGPRSRDLLATLCGEDLAADAFPYLAYREFAVAGVEARVMRVGFVGELGYEIHVPWDGAVALWHALHASAGPGGLTPFGVEAQRILRLEKGHVIIGQDTDALTSPDEAGLGWAVRMDKPSFTGQRSLEALRRRGPRQQLVAFELQATEAPFEECNLFIDAGEPVGRVTSLAASPTLGKVIGLALVAPRVAGRSELAVRDDRGALHTVRFTRTPFYDPRGERQRAALPAAP
jgi:sarcosine oxidase subunit alpha